MCDSLWSIVYTRVHSTQRIKATHQALSNLSSACERVSMAPVSGRRWHWQERPFGGWQEALPAAASRPGDAWRVRRWTSRRRLRPRSGSGSGFGSLERRRRGQKRGRWEERWRHSATRRRCRASGRASRARSRPMPRPQVAPETSLAAADTNKA